MTFLEVWIAGEFLQSVCVCFCEVIDGIFNADTVNGIQVQLQVFE
jgi:hypothetical protein